jgi:hypothetical protein
VPLDAKTVFRPEVLASYFAGFQLPNDAEQARTPIRKWAEVLASSKADSLNEKELLRDSLTNVFCGVLGYTRIVDDRDPFTFSREKHVQVDGKFADAVAEGHPVAKNAVPESKRECGALAN